ncbi:hypothetical protein U9M48_019185 [Paspalum notatum var. saurae]|uniref:Tf2-1-like SH3-like domain-containing protein n=1 Tax=Paspalum notatum var. saurae TaxID=547442 RepID=A0AAQ3WQZ5_PASNO
MVLSRLYMVDGAEHPLTGPNQVNVTSQRTIKFIHSNLKRAQSRQKSYSDNRRRPLVFEEGDHVYLRVSPMKGVHWFGVKGKLAPRYIGPFKITERCGPVAYRLELPPHLATVHDVFHVSQLKKCLRVPEEVIEPDLTYQEQPKRILDQKQRSTRRRTINFYKVQWSNHCEEEATWEQEEFLQTNILVFFHPLQTNSAKEGPTQEQPLIKGPGDEPLHQELVNQQQEDQQLAPDFTPETTPNISKKGRQDHDLPN